MLSKPNPASKNRNVQPLLSHRISRVFAGDAENTLMVDLTWRGLRDSGTRGLREGGNIKRVGWEPSVFKGVGTSRIRPTKIATDENIDHLANLEMDLIIICQQISCKKKPFLLLGTQWEPWCRNNWVEFFIIVCLVKFWFRPLSITLFTKMAIWFKFPLKANCLFCFTQEKNIAKERAKIRHKYLNAYDNFLEIFFLQ